MKLLILTFLLLTLLSCESHENIPRANELDALALRITRQLPTNWSLEKTGD